jgi:hypothetical protein
MILHHEEHEELQDEYGIACLAVASHPLHQELRKEMHE